MQEDQNPELPEGKSTASYRARWLFAHNRLHAIVHDQKSPSEQWDGYLEELKTADEVAEAQG
jgi:hypothetical protein